MFFYLYFYFYFFTCLLLPFPYASNRVACKSVAVTTSTEAIAFEYPHEEGDEHVVNAIVCSKEDLPQQVMDEFDRCAYFIPMYRQLNLLIRCRQEVFNGSDFTANQMRKELCFNRTIEHEFHMCMVRINASEGSRVPHASPLQTTDFLHCMKETAMKTTGKSSAAVAGCMVTVENTQQNTPSDVNYQLDQSKPVKVEQVADVKAPVAI